MTAPRRLPAFLLLGTASTFALASCASAAEPAAVDDGTIHIVASTNVYGEIAQEVGAGLVSVTSIIDSGAQDPHEFEPTAQDQLAVSEADLLIENGGGYDAFFDGLVEATGTTAPVITAAEFSSAWPGEGDDDHDHEAEGDDHEAEGDDHEGHDHIEGFNEHVWYDPHTMEHVVEAIAAELAELDPENAAEYEQNAAHYTEMIGDLDASLHDLDEANHGKTVFVTEPVPVYLTTAAGLTNLTPDAFSEAVEEGQDVPPATLLESLQLIENGDVDIVVVNAQTGGAETTRIIEAAGEQGIPVLEFSETLPEGETYLSCMQMNIAELQDALAE